MIDINIRDPHVVENTKASMDLKYTRIFTDNEMQALYARQVIKDREEIIDAMKEGSKCQSD